MFKYYFDSTFLEFLNITHHPFHMNRIVWHNTHATHQLNIYYRIGLSLFELECILNVQFSHPPHQYHGVFSFGNTRKVFHIILHNLFSISSFLCSFCKLFSPSNRFRFAIYLRSADHATFVLSVCHSFFISLSISTLHPLESLQLKEKCISNYRLRTQKEKKKHNKFSISFDMRHGQSLGQSRNRNKFRFFEFDSSICNLTIFHPSVKCVILH